MQNVTVNDALKFAAVYGEAEPELAKMLMEAAKLGSERFKIAMNGTVFDTQAQEYLNKPIPGQTASEFLIPEAGGKVMMTPYDYDQYRQARAQGKGAEWYRNFSTPNFQPAGAQKTPAQAEAEKYPSTDMSSAAVAARAKAKEETEVLRAKGENDRFQSIVNAGNDAPSKIATYRSAKNLLNQPGIDKTLGVFENGDFVSALGSFLDSGIGVPGFRVSGDDIRKIMTQTGVPPDVINNSQLLTSLLAQINFGFRSLAKGQGSISDFETKMFNSMGTGIRDTADTLKKKIEMLEAKAQFERDVARKLRKSGMSADDFKDDDEYVNTEQAYYERLNNIVNPKKAKTNAPASAPTAIGNSIRNQLGLKPRE